MILLTGCKFFPGAGITPISDQLEAREAAIQYIVEEHGAAEIEAVSDWQVERLTPKGLLGREIWEFTAEGWTITVRWNVVLKPDYEITIRTSAHGWLLWDGIVHADGRVDEIGWVENASSVTPAWAKDKAIEYVQSMDLQARPPADATWKEERITPEGLVGSETYRYAFEDWQIDVRYPVIPIPDYEVTMINLAIHFYWEGTVRATGAVEVPLPTTLEGEVIVAAEGTRSESWGIRVERGPGKYVGKEIGLGSYTEMREELKLYRGKMILAVVSRICPSWTESCCASVFEQCAQRVLYWESLEIEAQLDQEFQLSVRQVALIESESLSITFLDVLEDSRCPSDVVCIWAGNAEVELEVSFREEERFDLKPTSFSLNSYSEPIKVKRSFSWLSDQLCRSQPISQEHRDHHAGRLLADPDSIETVLVEVSEAPQEVCYPEEDHPRCRYGDR